MSALKPFFVVHRDLPREGPGVPEDVHWAVEMAGAEGARRVLDAACGPGADTVTLADCCRQADVIAVDKQPHFVDAARRRTERFGGRVRVDVGSYTDVTGPFDLIWCAGAAYFVGYPELLRLWSSTLAPGGVVAFSEPVWRSDPPSEGARAFWAGQGEVLSRPDHLARLSALGWDVIGMRWIVGRAWEAYYAPMKERIALLRADAPGPELAAVLDQSAGEIALWEAEPDEIAYDLYVVRRA